MKSLWWFLFCCLALVAQPALALTTDPPTCQLNNKNGVVHQTLCYGETVKIKATSSDENATLQWYRLHNSGNGWVAVTGATQSELTTGPGIYKAIFTFGDNSTCETENDTIDYWKAYQIDWNVAACRATISGVTPLPFPAQLVGASEINTPVDPNAEITYSWQVIPTPVQAEFSTSSSSIFPLTDGFFQDTTLGLHQVILTVSQQGSSCNSVDTMEVTLLPLHVWADTIISYGGQPAIAVAHASGGTEPYQFAWSGADSCLSGNCDQARISSLLDPIHLYGIDANGCSGFANQNQGITVIQPWVIQQIENSKNSITLKWQGGNDAQCLIVGRKGQPVDFIPGQNLTFSANSMWGNGNLISADEFILYEGSAYDSVLTVTGLDSLGGYYFSLFQRKTNGYFGVSYSQCYGNTTGLYTHLDKAPASENVEISNFLDEHTKQLFDNVTTYLKNAQENNVTLNDDEITIPVVFHFIGRNTSAQILAGQNDCRVESAINSLNDYFGSLANSHFLTNPPNPMKIRFCLAQHRPDNLPWEYPAKPGRVFHRTLENNTFSSVNFGDQPTLEWYREAINARFPPSDVLNISVIESFSDIGVGGLYIPNLDLCAIKISLFGSNSPKHNSCNTNFLTNPGYLYGGPLAHEVGHFFSLRHTFEAGCEGLGSLDCWEQGDGVCDTKPTVGLYFECLPPPSTFLCPENPRDIDNLMDYTKEPCVRTFTHTDAFYSQKARMRGYIFVNRPFMISNANQYKIFGVSGCGNSHPEPETAIRIFQGSKINCALAGNTITIGCNPIYEALSYQFTFTDENGGIFNRPATASNTILFPWAGFSPGGKYSVTCNIVYTNQGGGQSTLTVSANELFKFFNCDPNIQYAEKWYLQNKSILGFSDEGPTQVWPSNTHNIPVFTLNFDDGTLIYGSGYHLYSEIDQMISGSQFTDLSAEQNIGAFVYGNKIFDLWKIPNSPYPTFILCIGRMKRKKVTHPGELSFPVYSIRILKFELVADNWVRTDFSSPIEEVTGSLKFAFACGGTEIRLKNFDFINHQIRNFEVNLNNNTLADLQTPYSPFGGTPRVNPEFSSDGSTIVDEMGKIFHYDPISDMVSFESAISFPTNSIPYSNPFFSPDGKYIYHSRYVPGVLGIILQRVTVGQGCKPQHSVSTTLNASISGMGKFSTMAIGPDGYIYFPYLVSSPLSNRIARINNPNPTNINEPISVDLDAVEFFGTTISGNFSYQPFRTTVFKANEFLKICQACTTVKATTNYCHSDLEFHTGDGTVITGANSVSHQYSCPSGDCSFTLQVKRTGQSNALFTRTILVKTPTAPTVSGVPSGEIFCGQTVYFSISDYQNNWTYTWEFQETGNENWTQIFSSNNGQSISYTFWKSGTLRLTFSNPSNCGNSVSFPIIVNPNMSPVGVCEGINNTLALSFPSAGVAQMSFVWEKFNPSGGGSWETFGQANTNKLEFTPGFSDGRYRVTRAAINGCAAFTYEFNTLGELATYSGNLPFDNGRPLYLHRDQMGIAGTLSLNGATALVRGMATYNSNAVGGTVHGAYIDLLDGGQITMTNNSYMGPACQNMWGGIRVGSSLNSGTISLVNSTIEGAYTGIENESPIALTLNNAQIKNCYIGVKTGPVHPVYSQWTGSTFSSLYDRMPAPFDYTTYHNGASTFYRPGHTGSDGDGKFLMHVGLWLTYGTSSLTLPFQHSGNSFDGMGIGILDQGDNNTIHDNTFTNCHIGGIVGESGRNDDYSNNDITLPTTLAFKNTYQMEALGSYYVGNPAWSSLAALPMYSYGLYFKQTGDNISHRFTHNTIRSTINTANRYHVGIGNNGWGQKGWYSENTLLGLSWGIRGIQNFELYAKKNTFTNNEIAIGLYHDGNSQQSSTTYPLELKCNTFNHETASGTPRKGLVIGPNVVVQSFKPHSTGNGQSNYYDNQIGGDGSFSDGIYYPNANVWPTLSDRTQQPTFNGNEIDIQDPFLGWVDVPNWLSIDNHASNPTVNYYRYLNEFVRRNADPPVDPKVSYPIPTKKAATQGNLQGDPPVDPNDPQYEYPCDNEEDEWPILFPSRISVISGSSEQIQMQKPAMDAPIPNPAVYETRIPLLLPVELEQVVLQIVESGSGKVLQNISISDRGIIECILNVKSANSGHYLVRLLANGKSVGTQSLIVTK